MNSPPNLEPEPALPAHLSTNYTLTSGSPNARERQKLATSIASSSRGQANDSSRPLQTNGHSSKSTAKASGEDFGIVEISASRDPRDEPAFKALRTASRPASPYTLNPPIDFDGLSWPSESTEAAYRC